MLCTSCSVTTNTLISKSESCEAEVSHLSTQLLRTLWAHKVWTAIAIAVVVAIIQFVFLGVGFGTGDSGIEIGPITTAP